MLDTPDGPLIAFSGAMHRGKSKGAEHFEQKHGFVRLSYSDPLKVMIKHITPDGKIDKVRDRKLLQFVGTEYYRQTIDSDYWVKPLIERVNHLRLLQPGVSIVIDDCRFRNEFEAAEQLGAIFLHVIASDEVVSSRMEVVSEGLEDHESESHIGASYADEFITNEHSLEEYFEQLDTIFQMYRRKYVYG